MCLLNMKTIFRRNINGKHKKKVVLISALVALVLAAIIFYDFTFQTLGRPLFYVLRPIFKVKNNIENWKESIINDFADKNFLSEENKSLRGIIQEMEAKIAVSENLEKENIALKSVFSPEALDKLPREKKLILASVIYRPSLTPFDTLIIDSGSRDGIKEGMLVSAFGNVLLGYTEDVFPDISKIKLISSFGEEINVILESSQISAIALGRGAENLEITLPKSLEAKLGERIMTLGRQPLLVGFIERIERQTADPFQKIIIRLPVNIQRLKEVFILTNLPKV